jgi:hypothetical protein
MGRLIEKLVNPGLQSSTGENNKQQIKGNKNVAQSKKSLAFSKHNTLSITDTPYTTLFSHILETKSIQY